VVDAIMLWTMVWTMVWWMLSCCGRWCGGCCHVVDDGVVLGDGVVGDHVVNEDY